MVPLILILLATASAAAVAYGAHPDWILHSHGLSIITLSHRLQWPLTFLAVLLCILLIALVAAGRRRIFWLLGLAPVAALLFHHFRSDPLSTFSILENPPFVSATDAGNLIADDDYVVGLRLGDTFYAYPYSLLYTYPVILQSNRGLRLLLMWSPFANRASAAIVDHDIRARELDIVSMPANALLLYNSRLGQFINGLTCKTSSGDPITGVSSILPTVKTIWKQWRTLHPDTQLLAVAPQYSAGLPHRPVLPYFPIPAIPSDVPAGTRITLINPTGPAPIALLPEQITRQPLNLTPDVGAPVVLFRDPQSGIIRAFDRHIDSDITADFHTVSDPHRPGVLLSDEATQSGWSPAGVAVDGDKKIRGQKLTPIPVDDDLPYSVIKYWYPTLQLQHITPENIAATEDPPSPASNPAAPTHHHRTRRTH